MLSEFWCLACFGICLLFWVCFSKSCLSSWNRWVWLFLELDWNCCCYSDIILLYFDHLLSELDPIGWQLEIVILNMITVATVYCPAFSSWNCSCCSVTFWSFCLNWLSLASNLKPWTWPWLLLLLFITSGIHFCPVSGMKPIPMYQWYRNGNAYCVCELHTFCIKTA